MKPCGERKVSSKFCTCCHFNYVLNYSKYLLVPAAEGLIKPRTCLIEGYLCKNRLTAFLYMYIINFTSMRRSKPPRPVDAKTAALREQGGLHPHPDAVKDEAFRTEEFFDPRDRVQVRYEMVRRHRVDGRAVTEVAASFGVSRQAFYITEATFEGHGIPGLLPRRRGPKRAHKCTDEILDFVERWRGSAMADAGETVVQAIQRRFGVTIHPRSIDHALARRKKKRQAKAQEKA